MTRSLRPLIGLCLLAFGCADSTPELPSDGPSTVTRTQAVVDQTGPNWMVVGNAGRVEMVGGEDGEPDELTGRFVLEGSSIVATASGADRWVVAGPNRTQALDDDALRLAEARDALSGDTIGLIEPGPVGWLIAGANGRAQLLDALGEPTASTVQVLGNAEITAAFFNGTTWLLGSSSGSVVAVNQNFGMPGNPDGQVVDATSPIVAIVGEPTNATMDPPWLAFTEDSAFPISGTGVPQAPVSVVSGVTITSAAFGGGKVFVGTSDGRLGVSDYSSTPSFTFTPVLNGSPVSHLVSNGTDWIALGSNGQAQRFDNNGATLGAAVRISSGPGRSLAGAHWTGTRWLIVVAEIGLVAFVDDQLAPPRELTGVLGGADISDASSNGEQVLVVGPSGAIQLLDTLGNFANPISAVPGGTLNAVGWMGDHWLVAGDGGVVAIVDAQGAVMGSPTTLLDGQDIEFVSWSGEFFLIGGATGLVQVVRADGTQSSAAFQVNGATDLYAAQWSGRDWLVVGTDGVNGAYAQIVATDTAADATIVADTQALRAVDFNGIEFLVGGDGGLVQRVSAQGVTVDSPADVLTGFDIRDVAFNGLNYIVVGEFGALRRLGQDYLPLRTPIAVLDREDASAVLWTRPRGFPSGLCITNELCFEGPCVGGLTAGSCCDSACDRACESCFADDTGEPDGTCAPVVAGKQPPVKEGGAGCDRQSEGTCGLTGSCDGAGECAFYGADIICAEPVCSLGRYTPTAACSGAGACAVVDELDCAPYAGCTIDGCVETCNANTDCVDGYECVDSACVEVVDDEPFDGGTEDDADDGCCATASARPGSGPLALLFAAVWFWRRRS